MEAPNTLPCRPASGAMDNDGIMIESSGPLDELRVHVNQYDADKSPKMKADDNADDNSESAADLITQQNISRHSFSFWAIIFSLALSGFLTALEGTVVNIALPSITRDLGGGSLYVWVPNAYFLSNIATLPFISQISDIFGRRGPMLTMVALFIIGSGLCGGASSMAMLIIGRTM